MIQAFDPRTAEPVGEPVAETTDAEVDALVAGEFAAITDTETALGGERLSGEVAGGDTASALAAGCPTPGR